VEIPDKPVKAIHQMEFYSCGLDPDNGHFHVTERGAEKCIAKQKRAVKKCCDIQLFGMAYDTEMKRDMLSPINSIFCPTCGKKKG